MRIFKHKIFYILSVCLLVAACSPDEEKKYTETNANIMYDNYMVPDMNNGVYNYSDMDDQIKVVFYVDESTKSVNVQMKPMGGSDYTSQTITPSGNKCEVTYSTADLNWKKAGDKAWITLTTATQEKKITLRSNSTWIDLADYKEGDETNGIGPGKAFVPVQGKSLNDTIRFTASVSEWINVNAFSWDVHYKISGNGVETPIVPAFDEKNSALVIYNMKALGANAKDTVFFTAKVTNNGISRTGEYALVVQDLSPVVSSATSVSKDFKPSISNAAVDTVYMNVTIKDSGNAREWLEADQATWVFTYTVGESVEKKPLAGVKVKNSDIASEASVYAAFGQLPGLVPTDLVKVNGVMTIDGITYSVDYDFVVSK